MAIYIKQGDEYDIPIALELNGQTLDITAVEAVEVYLGDLRKTYPGEIEYDSENDRLLFPVTQGETFSMEENSAVPLDVRVRFINGDVMGSRAMKYITVYDAISEVVI